MKSCISTSPGWMGSSLSVIVNDLRLLRPSVDPYKTYSPLVIDPDAVLSGSVALGQLEPVPRRYAKVLQELRGAKLAKSTRSHPMDPGFDRWHWVTARQSFGVRVTERSDHHERI